jgi:Rrf2 family protein
MHLSSQEEYGLRCLLRLASHDGSADESPLRIQDIATSEGLSQEYVAKLMRILRNGELVTSTRGASGGYHLARPADEITVWQVIEVLGGTFFPESFCETHPGSLRDCVHTTNCSIRALWRNVGGLLESALSGVTLEHLQRGEQQTFAWLSEEGTRLDAGEPRQ